jgi:hypothetical protein
MLFQNLQPAQARCAGAAIRPACVTTGLAESAGLVIMYWFIVDDKCRTNENSF